jgi:AraC-like DNA-binding protein
MVASFGVGVVKVVHAVHQQYELDEAIHQITISQTMIKRRHACKMPQTYNRQPMAQDLATIKEVRFTHPRLKPVGIDLLHLADLKKRVSAAHLATPERSEFYMLLLVTEGYLRHNVDFVDMRLGAGSLVFVRPGQIQHWRLQLPVQGCMVMIDPPALPPVTDVRSGANILHSEMEDWPVGVRVDDGFVAELQIELQRLARDLEAYDGSLQDIALIRQVLLTSLLRVARWHRGRLQTAPLAESGPHAVFRLFRRELEHRFVERRTVAELAQLLGYSESTLNRACLAAAGETAKVLVDRRVALEAARMLAHEKISVHEIGHRLGFTEPTNFVRFFVRMVGSTPTEFRQANGKK